MHGFYAERLRFANVLHRIRYQVMNASPLNFKQEAAKLTELLNQYKLDDDSLFMR